MKLQIIFNQEYDTFEENVLGQFLVFSHTSCSLLTGRNLLVEIKFLTGFKLQKVIFKFPIMISKISGSLFPLELKPDL